MGQASEAVAVDTESVINEVDGEAMDEFGRTEAERTVVLNSVVAERINNEVDAGKHDTYVDALNYVIERGFKEIERVRESTKKYVAQKAAAKSLSVLNDVLSKNPKLVDSPQALVATLKTLGAYTPALATMLTNMGIKA